MLKRPIHVLEVRSELGAGSRGASLGIGAIKVASVNSNNNYFSRYRPTSIPDENELLFIESPTQHAKYIDGVAKVYSSVMEYVSSELIYKSNFIVVLAGDHSTAGGTIAGIRRAFPDKRLGVIWVDAHADMHTPFTTPSGNIHGMPLAISMGINNLDKKRNDIDRHVKTSWEVLKTIGNVSPKITPTELVFVGVRSTEPEEDYLINRYNIRNFTVEEIRQKGVAQIIEDVDEHLSHCELLYISFDVDSMDPELVSRGTGTPVENGLTPEEANDLVCGFTALPRSCCLEITEVNPTLDTENKMAKTAFKILDNATQVAEAKCQKIQH
ncbi:MAG: arginase [Saprospiraceae bacterium]|nr:arginase [Saprospiraceae bacterium]